MILHTSLGNNEAGHCVAMITMNEAWFLFDDGKRVKQITTKQDNQQRQYVYALFYTESLGPLMEPFVPTEPTATTCL